MSDTLTILNKKIADMYQTGRSADKNNEDDLSRFRDKVLDVIKYLYDVYMDDDAYIYAPYLGSMPQWINEDGFGIPVYTIPENEIPRDPSDDLTRYKRELFRDKVDYVYAGIEHFWLCINPGTDYSFDVYDWNLEYIMARKNGATSFPLTNDEGDIDGYLTW